jgi:hypothetical protein
LHRRIGETIEHLHSGSIEAHLPELAHHFGEAAAGGGLQKAVDYAVRAAQRADQLLAFEDAAMHYQRALQMLELGETPDDRRRCEVLIALGEAQLDSGDAARAAETCRQALPAARALNDAMLFARAASAVAAQMTFDEAEAIARVHLLREAVSRVGDGNAAVKVRLLRLLSQTRFWLDSDFERSARQEQIFDLAQRSGDPDAMIQALLMSHQFEPDPRRLRESRALIPDALRSAEAAGRHETVFQGRQALYLGHVKLGEGAAAADEVERLGALAERLRIRAWRSAVEAMKCQRALWEGRLGDAERHMQAALDLFPGSRMTTTYQVYVTQIGFVRRLQGRLAETAQGARRGAEIFPRVMGYPCHLACFLAEMGHEAEARETLAMLAEGGFAKVPRDGNYLMNLAMLSDACVILGDAQAAAVRSRSPVRGDVPALRDCDDLRFCLPTSRQPRGGHGSL